MGWFDDRERDDGYTAFVTSASPALVRTAWFLTGDVHAAEELVQATLVKLYVAWPRVRRGEVLGISVGAVKSAAYRGMARLRTHLETPKEGLS
ncbi:sigma factor [Janibacter sp. YB324]|uniref:sigma factor n=1 Tax=Janibacter sp. YB324 TaxID=2761047 RepID=UPI0016242C02|nr:sigma factor [Janibacter sp. YB324]QNF94893.1 hypothetical protein H7A72_03600 [Janibacter sp. YB324]